MKTTILMTAIILLVAVAVPATADTGTLPPGEKMPPTAFDRLSDAGEAADFDSVGYVIVFDSTENRINELGVTYTNKYMLYKIMTDEGCLQKAVLTWHYEPLSSMVDVEQISILRGDSIISVAVNGLLDLPAPQSGIYWGDRIKSLQLPRLLPGDGIEVKIKRKGFSYALLDEQAAVNNDNEKYIPPMPGEYFDIVVFESEQPIVEKTYVLKTPADKRLHSKVYNGPLYSNITYNDDTTIYSWTSKDVPARVTEKYTPDHTDLFTKVVIATVKDWESKSRWFFDVNEPQFEYTDAIKAKVDEILSNAGVDNGSDEEIAFELLHWVAQNIRYSGQTMGPGEGYTLHSGEMIFEQRSGVCKDIAGMLVTMMRAAGLDSYAAMTMAGSRIEEVPADQFNHCVVALRKADGSFVMYDPTWVPYNNSIWSLFEAEQHYLIGTPEGNALDSIAYSPPEESPLEIESNVTILDDGTLKGTLKLRGNGAMDNYMRGMLVWYPLNEVKSGLAKILSAVSDRVEIVEYEHGDKLDFKQPMWWRIEYRIPEFTFPIDGGLEFVSPMMAMTVNNRIFFRASYDWPEKRKDDVFLYFTQLIDGEEIITLPSGYKVDDPENSDEIDETYAYFKGESEMNGRKLSIKQKVEIKRRQIPNDGYDGFKKAVDEAKKFAETVFRAEKGGDR